MWYIALFIPSSVPLSSILWLISVRPLGISVEEKTDESEKIFEELIGETFPNLLKDVDLQI